MSDGPIYRVIYRHGARWDNFACWQTAYAYARYHSRQSDDRFYVVAIRGDHWTALATYVGGRRNV